MWERTVRQIWDDWDFMADAQRDSSGRPPDMDLLGTGPTCGRGNPAHRPDRTPFGTNGSALDSESVPGNITPKTPTGKVRRQE